MHASVLEVFLVGNKDPICQYTRYSLRGSGPMKKEEKTHVFPIEKKLAAIEWRLKLSKTSLEITHTPLRTQESKVIKDALDILAPNYRFRRS